MAGKWLNLFLDQLTKVFLNFTALLDEPWLDVEIAHEVKSIGSRQRVDLKLGKRLQSSAEVGPANGVSPRTTLQWPTHQNFSCMMKILAWGCLRMDAACWS